jgi:hypothetical protein
MRIAYVGGLDRAAPLLKAEAERQGHELELVSAPNSRRQMAELESAITRADFVIIVTELDSHNAVLLARKTAKRLGRPSLLTRKCGLARLRAVLEGLQPALLAAG